jgi:hypothetical protein
LASGEVLASCYGASVGDRQLLGDTPGQRTRKLVRPVREVPKRNEALADVGGVNVHAGAAIPAAIANVVRGCVATSPARRSRMSA